MMRFVDAVFLEVQKVLALRRIIICTMSGWKNCLEIVKVKG